MTRAMHMAVVFLMAATLGQANQCSAGSECPTDINSNNVASLLETKPQTGVFNDGGEGKHCSSGCECPSDDSPKHPMLMLQTNLQMHKLEVGGEAPTITFVTVTDESFQTNLGVSLLWQQRDTLPHEWLVLKNDEGAGISKLYAQAQSVAHHRLVVFLHPDVTLPDDWYANFRSKLAQIEAADPNWGVLGTAGVPVLYPDTPGTPKIASSIKSFGNKFNTGADNLPVQSLDEHLLVLRAGSPKFDPNLPGFDLYGTDIVLSARQAGLKSYLLNLNVMHKAKDADDKPVMRKNWLSKVHSADYQKRGSVTKAYMQNKWCASKFFPVYGTFYDLLEC